MGFFVFPSLALRAISPLQGRVCAQNDTEKQKMTRMVAE